MCEERYTQIVMYENYLLDLELNQRAMNDYVNECIILSNPDKKQVISELAVFNEGKVGDKFKKVWARIKSFFSKIYQRFLESLSAWASDNSDYLKSYANIIFEKKCTLKTIKMHDHFTGLDNFNKMVSNVSAFASVPDFTDMDQISAVSRQSSQSSEKATENVDAYTLYQQKELIKNVWGDSVVNTIVEDNDTSGFAGRCRNYMNGGEEVQTYSGSDMEGKKMELMYNFCYKYDALVDNLKKIREAYDKGMANIETQYKKGYDEIVKKAKNMSKGDISNQASDYVKAGADKADPNNLKDGSLGKELAQANKNIKDAKAAANQNANASYVYSSVYGKAINEAPEITTGGNNTDTTINKADDSYSGKNNSDLDKESNRISKAGTSDAKSIKNDSSTMSKSATDYGKAKASSNALSGKSQEEINRYEDTAINLLRAYGNARSLLMGAALNALSDTRKDWFDVIRAHVRTWVGTVNNDNQNTDTKPTNTTSHA